MPRSCAGSTQHGVTLHVRRAGGRGGGARRRRATWDGPSPGAGPRAHRASPARRRRRGRSSGSRPSSGWEFIQIYGLTETSPLLTMNRRRAEYDDLTTRNGRSGSVAPARPALGVRLARRRSGRGAGPEQRRARGLLGPAGSDRGRDRRRVVPHRRRRIIDDDGYLTISDRKKDVIISGGENVSSIEVEDALCSHPQVAEAAVIGVPDDKWGETVKALVVLAPGASVTEARADRALPGPPRALQVPDPRRAPRRARPHGDRQARRSSSSESRTGRVTPVRWGDRTSAGFSSTRRAQPASRAAPDGHPWRRRRRR